MCVHAGRYGEQLGGGREGWLAVGGGIKACVYHTAMPVSLSIISKNMRTYIQRVQKQESREYCQRNTIHILSISPQGTTTIQGACRHTITANHLCLSLLQSSSFSSSRVIYFSFLQCLYTCCYNLFVVLMSIQPHQYRVDYYA